MQPVLTQLNRLAWLALNAPTIQNPELQQTLAPVMPWLEQDPEAATCLRQHHFDLLAHDLLQAAQLPCPSYLQKRYRLGVVSQLATTRVYGELLEQLAPLQIPTVVQKGFWLANAIYPVATWRQYADLDLLIPPQHIHALDDRLQSLGWRPIFSALPGRQQLPAWVDAKSVDCLEYKRDIYCIDVHLQLLPHQLPHRLNMAAIWQRAQPTTLSLPTQALPIYTLDIYDTVLHLLVHASYHRLDMGMRAFLDIALLLRHWQERGEKWEWQLLWQRAQDARVDYLLAGPVTMMQKYFLPEQQLIPTRRFKPQVQRAVAHFQAAKFQADFIHAPARLSQQQHDFLTPLRWGGMNVLLRGLWHMLLPGKQRIAARYQLEPQSAAVYLYSLWRPWQLLGFWLSRRWRNLASKA